MAVIDGVIMNGSHIIIPEILKPQVLDQLHINHMGIEKTKLLVCKSIYWANINNDIESFIKIVPHVLNFSKNSQRTKSSIMTS